jgi:hypothetical protein
VLISTAELKNSINPGIFPANRSISQDHDPGNIAMTNPELKLKDLDIFHGFIRRHIGPGAEDEAAMLAELGMKDIDDLLDMVVP